MILLIVPYELFFLGVVKKKFFEVHILLDIILGLGGSKTKINWLAFLSTDGTASSTDFQISDLIADERKADITSCHTNAQTSANIELLHAVSHHRNPISQVTLTDCELSGVDVYFLRGQLYFTFDQTVQQTADPKTAPHQTMFRISHAGIYKILTSLKLTGVIPSQTQVIQIFILKPKNQFTIVLMNLLI